MWLYYDYKYVVAVVLMIHSLICQRFDKTRSKALWCYHRETQADNEGAVSTWIVQHCKLLTQFLQSMELSLSSHRLFLNPTTTMTKLFNQWMAIVSFLIQTFYGWTV